jgi:hypothetical protein
MVEATQTIPRSFVVITIATQIARNAVKEQLRAQGTKPQFMRVREINAAAPAPVAVPCRHRAFWRQSNAASSPTSRSRRPKSCRPQNGPHP